MRLSDVSNFFSRAWNKFTGFVSSIWGSIFPETRPNAVSPEYKAALKAPIVKYGDKYALNPDLDLNSWSINFVDGKPGDTFKKRPEIETKNLRLRPIGYGPRAYNLQHDINFIARKLYGDTKVTATYATGRSYTPVQAFLTAVARFNMFAQRLNAEEPCLFTGFIIESRVNNKPIGLINVGTTDIVVNGDELKTSGTVVEPAIMIASDYHRQGVASEAAVAGLLYMSQLKAKGYKTPAGKDFDALAFTARPGNPIPERIGAEVIGQSNKFGNAPEHARNVHRIRAADMVDLVNNTIERDNAAQRPTIRLH